VLNAFRHHGIGHKIIHYDPGRTLMCSTPSGIMESVTKRDEEGRCYKYGAQRLPASWNRSHLYDHSGITIATVLNAFRHHGIGHG